VAEPNHEPAARTLFTTGTRGFGDYVFEITSDDESTARYVQQLVAAFGLADGDDRSIHRFEVLNGEDGGDRLVVDGEEISGDPVPGRIVHALVHILTRRLLDSCDALGLHAGGVTSNGVGLAFPAHMESGKSTLTTGLVRAGFGYLSDEAVLLDWETLMVIPFPKPISLDPGSWHLFPELEPQAPLPSGYKENEWQLPPSAIRRDAVAGSCRIEYFVFPKYADGAETRLTPIRRAEATIELAKNTFRFNERPRRSLDALAAVVHDVDCFQLSIGDLETAVALVTELVEVGR